MECAISPWNKIKIDRSSCIIDKLGLYRCFLENWMKREENIKQNKKINKKILKKCFVGKWIPSQTFHDTHAPHNQTRKSTRVFKRSRSFEVFSFFFFFFKFLTTTLTHFSARVSFNTSSIYPLVFKSGYFIIISNKRKNEKERKKRLRIFLIASGRKPFCFFFFKNK
jgi:hypothetical protein